MNSKNAIEQVGYANVTFDKKIHIKGMRRNTEKDNVSLFLWRIRSGIYYSLGKNSCYNFEEFPFHSIAQIRYKINENA